MEILPTLLVIFATSAVAAALPAAGNTSLPPPIALHPTSDPLLSRSDSAIPSPPPPTAGPHDLANASKMKEGGRRAFLAAFTNTSTHTTPTAHAIRRSHHQTHITTQWHAEHYGDLRAGRYAFAVPQRRYGASMVAIGQGAETVTATGSSADFSSFSLADDASSLSSSLSSSRHADASPAALVLLYGYNYDHARRRAVWLDDVWAFHPSPPLARLWAPTPQLQQSSGGGGASLWTPPKDLVPDGKKDDEALSGRGLGGKEGKGGQQSQRRRKKAATKFPQGLWRRKATTGPRPPPSYKHMAVALHELILVFGGDDGGSSSSSSSSSSFQWGSFYEDLYVLSANSWRWRRILQVGAPPARQGGTLSIVASYAALTGGGSSGGGARPSFALTSASAPLVVLFGGTVRRSAGEPIVPTGGALDDSSAAAAANANANSDDSGDSEPPSPLVESNSVYVMPASDLEGRPKRVAWHRCLEPPPSAASAVDTSDKSGQIDGDGSDGSEFSAGDDDEDADDAVDFDADRRYGRTWPTPRRSHSAAAGPDGSLYIFGGFATKARRRTTLEEAMREEERANANNNNNGVTALTGRSTAAAAEAEAEREKKKKRRLRARLSPTDNLGDLWRLVVTPRSTLLLQDAYECHWERLWPPLRPLRSPSASSQVAADPTSSSSPPPRSRRRRSLGPSPAGRGGHAMAVISSPVAAPSAASAASSPTDGGNQSLSDSDAKAKGLGPSSTTFSVSVASHVVVTAGAACSLGCKCLADTWHFDLKRMRWLGGPATDGLLASFPFTNEAAEEEEERALAPVPRYHVAYATLRDRLFLFGGEGYAPYAYWNDMWSLELSATTTTMMVDASNDTSAARRSAVGRRVSSSASPLLSLSSSSSASSSWQPPPRAPYTLSAIGNATTNLMLRTRDEEEIPPNDRRGRSGGSFRGLAFYADGRVAVPRSPWRRGGVSGGPTDALAGREEAVDIDIDFEEGDADYMGGADEQENVDSFDDVQRGGGNGGRPPAKRGRRRSTEEEHEVDDEKGGGQQQRLYSFDELDRATRHRLLHGDADPLLPGSAFGGHEAFELSFPVLTFFFLLPLAMGFSAVVGFSVIARRRMRLWRKQNK